MGRTVEAVRRTSRAGELKFNSEDRGVAMKSIWLYRTAAVGFVLFALGHTFGFLSFRPRTAEGLTLYNATNSVHLVTHAAYTYIMFYTRVCLLVTAYMLSSPSLRWHLR